MIPAFRKASRAVSDRSTRREFDPSLFNRASRAIEGYPLRLIVRALYESRSCALQ